MRWSEAGYLSRIVLSHAPRQVSVSLILDVRQNIMASLFQKSADAGNVQIIHVADPEWGFTDRALPKLQAVLSRLGHDDIFLSNSCVTLQFHGRKKRFERAVCEIEALLQDPDFSSFSYTTAEGPASAPGEIQRLIRTAMNEIKEK